MNKVSNFFKLLQKSFKKFWYDRCLEQAAALTYATILSLVPIVTISFSVVSRFKLSEVEIRAFLLKYFLPESNLIDIIENNIEKFIKNTATLSIVSLIALFLISIALLGMVEKAFNRIWRVEKGRSLFHKFITFWTMLTLTPVLLGISIGVVGRLEHFSLSPFLISLSLSFIALFFLYWLFPATKVSLKAALFGSFIASLFFEIAKWAFKYYISYYATFDKIYGALSVIPVFFVWLFWSWTIVLLGAESSFIFDHPSIPLKASYHYHLFSPVLVLLEILKNFQEKKKRLTAHDLAQRLNLPVEVVNIIVNDFFKKGWIVYTENGCWLPNCPLEELRLIEIINIDQENKINKIWETIKECLQKTWKNITLGELISEERQNNGFRHRYKKDRNSSK
ncbi:MAG TPA: YihY family inner membrane protein [Candidatus Desulfofervidus auxilii]|uniref:YihY family inner membrane protein n=1 Tax=Desulfofervidus auxilii TaxID=1621989 RepID=A0A7C0U2G1_DESA2|nr:YihY family inner membrane protein [Candidatus Desulfofervidus auxilii]